MSLIKKLAGQTAVYGLSSMVGRMLNYLLTPLLTNYFATGQYGINTEFFAYISFLNVLFTYGMETTYFRFSQSEPDENRVYSTANISLLISTVIMGLLLAISVPYINIQLHYEQHPSYMYMMLGILIFDTLAVIPFARLRQHNKPLLYAGIKLTNIFIYIAAVVFFVVVCPKLGKYQWNWLSSIYSPSVGIGYVFIANLIASGITLLIFIPSLLKINWQWDTQLWKRMMPYTLPMLIVGLGYMVNETFDKILLNFFHPTGADAKSLIGIYGACGKIAIIITIFVQAFRMAAEPFFFNHSKESDSRKIYAQVMQVFIAACLLILLGTLLFIDVIKYYIAEPYRVGLWVVPILLVANLCLGIYYNLSIWYKLTNQTLMGSYITIGGALLTLILNIWLMPIYGYMGAAWTTLACYFSIMLASYLLGQKYFPVPYPLKNILKQVVLIVSVYGISLVLVKNYFVQFGIFAAQSILGTGILICLFGAACFGLWKMNWKGSLWK